jgi:hypothetical protein
MIAPLGWVAKAAGQEVRAIKVTPDTWVVTGVTGEDPAPPKPRTLSVGAGTGSNLDGTVLPDTIRVSWDCVRLGIVSQYVEIIDPDNSAIVYASYVDSDATYWQSDQYQIPAWNRLVARVTVTDKQGRVSQTVSEKFYGMGKPSEVYPTREGVYGDRLTTFPLADADVSVQAPDGGLYKIIQQVKNPDALNEWWSSSPDFFLGNQMTTKYGAQFGKGKELRCRYVMENDYGKTVSDFTVVTS